MCLLPSMASLFANSSAAAVPPGDSIAVPPGGSIAAPDAWVDDGKGDTCNRCFKTIKPGVFTSGKHHCRRCGQMVCGACSKRKIGLARLGHGETPVRVCDHCFAHERRRTACLRAYIPQLMQGHVFTKWPSGGRKKVGLGGAAHPRVVRLMPDQQTIVWHKQGEAAASKAAAGIRVQDITAVNPTMSCAVSRDALAKAGRGHCCVSVVAKSRSLDLECATPEEAQAWLQTIGEFVRYAKLESPEAMRAQSQARLDKLAQKEAREAERQARQEHREKLRAKYAAPKGGGGS